MTKAAITVSHCDHAERINCRLIERRYRKGKLTKFRAWTISQWINKSMKRKWICSNFDDRLIYLTQITTNSTQLKMFPEAKSKTVMFPNCAWHSQESEVFVSRKVKWMNLSQLLDILQHIISFSRKPTIWTLFPLVLHEVNTCLFFLGTWRSTH